MRNYGGNIYIFTVDAYLSLLNGNLLVRSGDPPTNKSVPLNNINSIISFSDKAPSSKLMLFCAKNNIGLSVVDCFSGECANIVGDVKGSILTRHRQYRYFSDEETALLLTRKVVLAKLENQKRLLKDAIRSRSELNFDKQPINEICNRISALERKVDLAASIDSIRGYEGDGANQYFSVFDNLITAKDFKFNGRSQRPPLDEVNCLLSFGYSILTRRYARALVTIGLDSTLGFCHSDRSGRDSLACDMVEELRAPIVDRFVLTIINRRQITLKDFQTLEDGAILLTDAGRKKFYQLWEENQAQTIMHGYLGVTVPKVNVMYLQAQLLSQYIRSSIDGYPPFIWQI